MDEVLGFSGVSSAVDGLKDVLVLLMCRYASWVSSSERGFSERTC